MLSTGIARALFVAAIASTVVACTLLIDTDGLHGGDDATSNPDGETGAIDGATDASPDVATIPKVEVAQLGAGDAFACGRRIDGTVMCWGYGGDGQLGHASDDSASAPVLVSFINDAVDLSVGAYHACVVQKTGQVSCWGYNEYGQLGDGTTNASNTPRGVIGITDGVKVAAGGNFSCAIVKSGAVRCWGANIHGSLGNGLNDDSDTPVDVQVVQGATQIAAAENNACALVANGEVYCWGDNYFGTVGNGNIPEDARTPVKINLPHVTALSASGPGEHMCALLGTGEVRCWGLGESGSLGNGNTSNSGTPVPVVALNDVKQLSAGGGGGCVVRGNGTVSCWGANDWRQLGIGDTSPTQLSSSPVPVEGLANVAQVASGGAHVCALLVGGQEIKCWGMNVAHALGRNTVVYATVPAKLGLTNVTSVGIGHDHTCAIAAGKVSCWGSNQYAQLARTDVEVSGAPLAVESVDLAGATKIAGGYRHACAATPTGARCWGNGELGQLGNGGRPSSEEDPVLFNLNGVVPTDVQCGSDFTCALLSTKQVACTGNGNDGRLGRPANGASDPGAVQGADGGFIGGVDKIALGWNFGCALQGSTLSCWGDNDSGQLGRSGDGSSQLSVVSLASGVVDVAAGDAHVCVVLTDKSVRCWGSNENGQVSGSGSGGPQPRMPNLGGKAVKSVAAGDDHSCALFEDGTMKCWGAGSRGQLGDGLRKSSTEPVTVANLTGIASIAADEGRTCAITTNGELHCWGSNILGELGDGTPMMSGVVASVFGY